MLKVNVGLSRKLSRDYNSTGFSINVEGELGVNIDDPETVVEKVKEFYDLAEDALSQQIERYQGDCAIASRDGDSGNGQNQSPNHQSGNQSQVGGRQNGGQHQGQGSTGTADAATNKQIQYLLNLGKRHGLTPQQLEGRIEATLGRKIGVYQLSKHEAGELIDVLNQGVQSIGNGNGNGRSQRG